MFLNNLAIFEYNKFLNYLISYFILNLSTCVFVNYFFFIDYIDCLYSIII
jgi:hypothetical protein